MFLTCSFKTPNHLLLESIYMRITDPAHIIDSGNKWILGDYLKGISFGGGAQSAL